MQWGRIKIVNDLLICALVDTGGYGEPIKPEHKVVKVVILYADIWETDADKPEEVLQTEAEFTGITTYGEFLDVCDNAASESSVPTE